ncbi:hypothetical protein F5Y16DRAFT_417502 [Xylariaceae sp. FL0255]|nr:hypothetical protein F5Y16DRAFT_417502 [Xylariaceae sp. FL0255]
MAEFTVFRRLPKELRLEIWEEALREELHIRRTQLVLILHDFKRIVPMKHLVSPFLSVNRESRSCALKQYKTKLSVYKVPLPEPDKEAFLEFLGERRWDMWMRRKGVGLITSTSEGPDLREVAQEDAAQEGVILGEDTHFEEHTALDEDTDSEGDADFEEPSDNEDSDFAFEDFDDKPWLDTELFHRNTEKPIQNIEKVGVPLGVIYINSKAERFAICYENEYDDLEEPYRMLEPFWVDAAARLRGQSKSSEPGQASWQYITQEIRPRTLSRIKSVVLVEHWVDEYDGTLFDYDMTFDEYAELNRPYFYPFDVASRLWKTHIFTGLRNWGHLWLDVGLRCFSHKISTKSAAELPIRLWRKQQRQGVPDSEATVTDAKAHRELLGEYQEWQEDLEDASSCGCHCSGCIGPFEHDSDDSPSGLWDELFGENA